MNAKTTRILKEARALFWPWCVVTITGGLSVVLPQSHPILLGSNIRELSLVGFFCGIHLLATLSFGNEFQHRTLSLLLSQPVNRMEIWGEKLSVTFAAVLSAALVCCYAWRSELQEDPKLWVLAGVYLITAIASATFWTLFARSTMGGFALNVFASSLVQMVVWNWEQILGPNPSPARSITALWTVAFGAFCLAGAMLWLGGRKLARFQVTGGMGGDDLLMAGPSVMPEALAGLFRCRPTGAVPNLIRKEFRLLRPLWLIALLFVLYLTCLTMLRLLPDATQAAPRWEVPLARFGDFGWGFPARDTVGRRAVVPIALFLPVGLLPALIAILAGSLSLGEERTSGTHSWHMTLPVPARRQWLIKLVMAMFTGFVCAVLLPALVLIAGGFIFGSPFMFVNPKAAAWPLLLLLSFASFWCACAVNGTVRAALWVFPVLITLLFAGQFGERVAIDLMLFVFSRFHFFSDFRFTHAFSNIQLPVIRATPTLVLTLLLVPTLLFAVIQSYRLFRAQLQDSALSVIRNLAPLVITAFLCTFSLVAFYVFVGHAKNQMWTLFRETHVAIEKILFGIAKLDATHPLQLTEDDLAKASHLSDGTRRWLLNAHITVTPDKAHPGGFYCAETPRKSTWCYYSATIHLADGTDLTESYEPTINRKFPFGRLSVLAHWPGTEGQDSLWDR